MIVVMAAKKAKKKRRGTLADATARMRAMREPAADEAQAQDRIEEQERARQAGIEGSRA